MTGKEKVHRWLIEVVQKKLFDLTSSNEVTQDVEFFMELSDLNFKLKGH